MTNNIRYQSFCWVLGTTSFRTADLNRRIEEMLLLLRSFKDQVLTRDEIWRWEANEDLQEEFYQYMLANNALSGDAPRKAKDARQKTSGLETLGLVSNERVITDAGKELLAITDSERFASDNSLQVSRDSFVYLKQLLKSSVKLPKERQVRPFVVLAYLLDEFDHLTHEEFTFLLPLVIDTESLRMVREGIKKIRGGVGSIDEVLFSVLKSKSNYADAYTYWMESQVTSEVVTTIGMNRKSRKYDEVYFALYKSMERVFLGDMPAKEEVIELYEAARALNGPAGTLWRKALFAGATLRSVRSNGLKAVAKSCLYRNVRTVDDLKQRFFRDLHLYKARATLLDYSDLNRRYFRLTETVLFEDSKVSFDAVPRAYFSLAKQHLLPQMFCASELLEDANALEEIAPGFDVSESDLLAKLEDEFGQHFESVTEIGEWVRDERYARLGQLLDTQFTQAVFFDLLDCFEQRNDARIAELVTHDATPSTIFEYVVALIWYEISDREGDILDYMKLQLEADLMPRSHAKGGTADIIYEYKSDLNFVPAHDLLIEVTLALGSNERQMEMEPVSRHLGSHRVETGNLYDYCLFIAPSLDINIVNDFRYRKIMGWIDPTSDGRIGDMKIIPIDIGDLREILHSGWRYRELYSRFDQAFALEDLNAPSWQEQLKALLREGDSRDTSAAGDI